MKTHHLTDISIVKGKINLEGDLINAIQLNVQFSPVKTGSMILTNPNQAIQGRQAAVVIPLNVSPAAAANVFRAISEACDEVAQEDGEILEDASTGESEDKRVLN